MDTIQWLSKYILLKMHFLIEVKCAFIHTIYIYSKYQIREQITPYHMKYLIYIDTLRSVQQYIDWLHPK